MFERSFDASRAELHMQSGTVIYSISFNVNLFACKILKSINPILCSRYFLVFCFFVFFTIGMVFFFVCICCCMQVDHSCILRLINLPQEIFDPVANIILTPNNLTPQINDNPVLKCSNDGTLQFGLINFD